MCYNTDSVLTSSQKHVCDTEMNRTRKSWKKINSKKNKNKKQLTEKIQSKAQYMKAILRTTSSLWWKGFVEKARLDALCRDVHGVKNTSPAQQAKAQPGLAQTETNHSPALPGPTQPNLACLSPICKNNDVTLLSCAVGAGQFHNWKSITRFYSSHCRLALHYIVDRCRTIQKWICDIYTVQVWPCEMPAYFFPWCGPPKCGAGWPKPKYGLHITSPMLISGP